MPKFGRDVGAFIEQIGCFFVVFFFRCAFPKYRIVEFRVVTSHGAESVVCAS